MQKMLWLFDIDGVLVNIPTVHKEAYRNNYRSALGINLSDKTIVSKFGATELATHIEILREIGVPASRNVIKSLISNQPKNFIKLLKKEKITPLDGVIEFLEYLKRQKQHPGIVTGNLREPAEYILKKAGLSTYFKIISCDDGKILERAKIIQNAVSQAKVKKYKYEKVVVFGDTPRDIESARNIGAFSVAVSTGTVSYSELKSYNPDLILRTMKDYMKIIKILSKELII